MLSRVRSYFTTAASKSNPAYIHKKNVFTTLFVPQIWGLVFLYQTMLIRSKMLNYVTRAPLLLLWSWVALSSKVVSLWVRASGISNTLSTKSPPFVVRFPLPSPRRWVGGPMSQKGGDETVSVSASFRCSLMGECDTDLEFCLSKDSSGAPKVGIDHRWQVQGEFESRVRAMKSFTRHSRDINATLTQHSRVSSAIFTRQWCDISAAIWQH